MNPLLITAILSIVTAAVTSILTHYLSLRKKIDEVNFQKKRELNVILGDLLNVYSFFEVTSSFISLETLQDEYLVAWGEYKRVIFHSEDIMKIYEANPFTLLKQSIQELKQFDGVAFANLQSMNESLELNREIVNSILESSDTPKDGLNFVHDILTVVTSELKSSILSISQEISTKTFKKVKKRFKEFDKKQEEELDDLIKKSKLPNATLHLRQTIVLIKKIGYKNMYKEIALRPKSSPEEIIGHMKSLG